MTFRLKVKIIKIAQAFDILKTHSACDTLQLFFFFYILLRCINCIDLIIHEIVPNILAYIIDKQ